MQCSKCGSVNVNVVPVAEVAAWTSVWAVSI